MTSSAFVELRQEEVRRNLKAIAVSYECLSLSELLMEGSLLLCAFSSIDQLGCDGLCKRRRRREWGKWRKIRMRRRVRRKRRRRRRMRKRRKKRTRRKRRNRRLE